VTGYSRHYWPSDPGLPHQVRTGEPRTRPSRKERRADSPWRLRHSALEQKNAIVCATREATRLLHGLKGGRQRRWQEYRRSIGVYFIYFYYNIFPILHQYRIGGVSAYRRIGYILRYRHGSSGKYRCNVVGWLPAERRPWRRGHSASSHRCIIEAEKAPSSIGDSSHPRPSSCSCPRTPTRTRPWSAVVFI
jgi:hypothetical protein